MKKKTMPPMTGNKSKPNAASPKQPRRAEMEPKLKETAKVGSKIGRK